MALMPWCGDDRGQSTNSNYSYDIDPVLLEYSGSSTRMVKMLILEVMTQFLILMQTV